MQANQMVAEISRDGRADPKSEAKSSGSPPRSIATVLR